MKHMRTKHMSWFWVIVFALPLLASAHGSVRGKTTLAAVVSQDTREEAAAIANWLRGYDAAFNAKDLETLADFYHPDVTIYEGGGVNIGWADYRDHHLGPELKAFEGLEFAHVEVKVTVLGRGESAYAIARYSLKAKMGEREIDAEGLATYVLVSSDSGWKIRHSHTSSRRRGSE